MPRRRFHRLDPLRQRRILVAAAEEFAANGYRGASLNRLVDRLGIGKGTLYYYFDDKADLFSAVVELTWQAVLPEVGLDVDALSADEFWPRLAELLRQVRRRVREQPWVVGVTRLLYDPPADERIRQTVARSFDEARRWQAAVLERGQEIGAVRSDLPADLLLVMLVGADEAGDRWLVTRWDELGTDRQERLSEAVFDVLRRMLAPPEAG